MLLEAVLIEHGNDVGLVRVHHVDSIADLPNATLPAL